ncbi:oxidoreductase-like protein [Chaetomium sp. MPI-CAGE-AT-0009]|nr:oxidoreductase-like protein [Chaetomium sp. MPI-CAGE-AT-0009]
MRRTFLSTGPSRAVYRAFGGQQSRRTFATPPIKADTPPSPIEPSKEQAHPVGPFYEAVLRTPAGRKSEVPPVTSKASPAPTPKPAPAQPKPVQEKPAAAAPAAEEKAAPQPAGEDKKAARRPRKAKQAAADETSPSSKAKSVPSSSSSSSSPDTLSPPPPQSPPPEPEPAKQEEPRSNDEQARSARVVFGASLAGPAERAERLARLRAESRVVAGVVVPPRPEEPDNCCMSGCVNCVWDRYRDDMEEWAARSAEADRRLAADDAGAQVGVTEDCMDGVERGRVMELGLHDGDVDRAAVGGDDDGGGSVGGWEIGGSSSSPPPSGRIVKDFWDEELYKNVPVGIREFMKHEKRLKEKHRREGTAGG